MTVRTPKKTCSCDTFTKEQSHLPENLINSYLQGSLYYQPKQCTSIREFPQCYHIFALFDPPQMGNVMTPDLPDTNLFRFQTTNQGFHVSGSFLIPLLRNDNS